MNAPSLGRNDPCHCGSGKKYKKCHLEVDERSASQRLAQALPSSTGPGALFQASVDSLSDAFPKGKPEFFKRMASGLEVVTKANRRGLTRAEQHLRGMWLDAPALKSIRFEEAAFQDAVTAAHQTLETNLGPEVVPQLFQRSIGTLATRELMQRVTAALLGELARDDLAKEQQQAVAVGVISMLGEGPTSVPANECAALQGLFLAQCMERMKAAREEMLGWMPKEEALGPQATDELAATLQARMTVFHQLVAGASIEQEGTSALEDLARILALPNAPALLTQEEILFLEWHVSTLSRTLDLKTAKGRSMLSGAFRDLLGELVDDAWTQAMTARFMRRAADPAEPAPVREVCRTAGMALVVNPPFAVAMMTRSNREPAWRNAAEKALWENGTAAGKATHTLLEEHAALLLGLNDVAGLERVGALQRAMEETDPEIVSHPG